MKSTPIANLVIFGGIGLISTIISLAAINPQFPIWLAILVASIVGTPVLLIGFWLHPNSTHNDGTGSPLLPSNNIATSRRFLPTRTEMWGVAGFLTYFFSLSVPVLFFLPLLLLPAGDNWPIVLARILLATASFCASWWWISLAKKKFPKFFRGRLSDEVIDSFIATKPQMKPNSPIDAALKNWQLPVLTAAACLVFWGIVNINNPGLNINGWPRRFRGVVRLLVWCLGNPNTVRSASALVGLTALMLYAHRVRSAYVLSKPPT